MRQHLRETDRLEVIKVENNIRRKKMTPAERAKQFMPFSALKGLEDALREKEIIKVPKPELSEDAAEIIDRTLRQLEPLNIITVVHYKDGEYLQTKGVVAKIDKENKRLQIVDTLIEFNDILDITL